MARLKKLSVEELKELKLKSLYRYRTEWYDKYQKNYNDSAFNEFLKAKKLIKVLEAWEDKSKENFKKLRYDTQTYNDFLNLHN